MSTQVRVLYFATFIANASILVFEIAGARLLAPYLGTSVEVWAGTIAVILGGMAIGYYAGGILADKRPEKSVLGVILFGAGLAALLAFGLRDIIPPLLSETHALPLTFAAMVAAALLFAPTTVLLAALSPFIAKFLLTTLNSSAKTVGSINAVGTLGSITGAILAGSFLIPTFPLGDIFFGIAVVLLALALLVSTTRMTTKVVAMVVVGVVSLASSSLSPITLNEMITADLTTLYNRIWILETAHAEGTLRAIRTDPFGTQCAMLVEPDGTINEKEILFTYVEAFDIVAKEEHGSETPLRALFLGGCNYSYPRAFLHGFPNASAVVVEIDPGMTKTAEDYFGFVPSSFPSLSIVHEDARRYVARKNEGFDIIFMDTFGSSSNIPYHLTTKENFESLSKLLTNDGILVVNIIGPLAGPSAAFTSSLETTTKNAFEEVALYSLGSFAIYTPQNLILLARNNGSLPDSLSHPEYPDLTLTKVENLETTNAMVLTDDFAPVEYLTRDIRERVF